MFDSIPEPVQSFSNKTINNTDINISFEITHSEELNRSTNWGLGCLNSDQTAYLGSAIFIGSVAVSVLGGGALSVTFNSSIAGVAFAVPVLGVGLYTGFILMQKAQTGI